MRSLIGSCTGPLQPSTIRSGSSLTERVCRAATFPEPEGTWKYPQTRRMPPIQLMTLNSFTVYSLRRTDRSPEAHQEDEAKQDQDDRRDDKRQRAIPEFCF